MGSLQYNELKRWMLGNAHGGMMLMHNPLVRDLKVEFLWQLLDLRKFLLPCLAQADYAWLQQVQGLLKVTWQLQRRWCYKRPEDKPLPLGAGCCAM